MTDDKTTPNPKDIWRNYEEKQRAFQALSASLRLRRVHLRRGRPFDHPRLQ